MIPSLDGQFAVGGCFHQNPPVLSAKHTTIPPSQGKIALPRRKHYPETNHPPETSAPSSQKESALYIRSNASIPPPAHPRSPRPRKLVCRRRGDLPSEGVYVRRGCSCRSRAKTTVRTYTQNPRHLKLCECKEPITQNLAKMGNEKTGNTICIREKMLQRALIFGTVTAYTRTDRSPVRPLTPRG